MQKHATSGKRNRRKTRPKNRKLFTKITIIEKKKEETYKNNEKEEKDTKPKEKRYASTKEGLKGISKDLIQKHKSVGAFYWRCGLNNYCTTECFTKTAENGDSLDKTTLSSQRKRKRNDDYKGSEDTKKAKMVAI
jgi:hypothetical protein